MNDTKRTTADGKVLQFFRIHPGDGYYVADAWEPTSGPMGGHSTITTFDGVWYGQIGTRRLPADLDALPAYSDERSQAVRAWMAEEDAEARNLLREHLADVIRDAEARGYTVKASGHDLRFTRAA